MTKKNNINTEAKSYLANLLATENLTVVHRKVKTASFDVKNRVLTLPIFKQKSGDVYQKDGKWWVKSGWLKQYPLSVTHYLFGPSKDTDNRVVIFKNEVSSKFFLLNNVLLLLGISAAVSYTHLTLPTNREV